MASALHGCCQHAHFADALLIAAIHPNPKALLVRAAATWTYITFTLLIIAWTIVWLAKVHLVDPQHPWVATDAGSFAYWTTAKLLIWIVPAIWLFHLSGNTLRQTFNLSLWRRWLVWGGGIGLLIALTGFVPKALAGQPLLPTQLSFALVNVLIIAPIFEELLIRGAVLGNLQRRYSFWVANALSSVMFVVLHMPGWYFMGSLAENMTKPIGGAVSIAILGMIFGYAVHKGRSVASGMIAHFLNNLASLR